ncbi:MAG: hypothetical protein QG667_235 [Pseudomonadota bacterium]|nr:hypothetical protein [Pseudomonadota bacterium]
MSTFKLKHLLAGAAMLAAAAGAVALKPTIRMADSQPVNFEQMVPKRFGVWQLDPTIIPVEVDPEIQAKLDNIYSQTLSRTYINDKGQRVMLSIAYGEDQNTEKTQAHRPEFCYRSQGFGVKEVAVVNLGVDNRQIVARQLLTQKPNRIEPVTYWMTIGEHVSLPGWRRKVTQLRYGLRGYIADGLLFRVSSLGAETAAEYQLQQAFISDLNRAIPEQVRSRIFGSH